MRLLLILDVGLSLRCQQILPLNQSPTKSWLQQLHEHSSCNIFIFFEYSMVLTRAYTCSLHFYTRYLTSTLLETLLTQAFFVYTAVVHRTHCLTSTLPKRLSTQRTPHMDPPITIPSNAQPRPTIPNYWL